jgi:hypothetical protein
MIEGLKPKESSERTAQTSRVATNYYRPGTCVCGLQRRILMAAVAIRPAVQARHPAGPPRYTQLRLLQIGHDLRHGESLLFPGKILALQV